jgi:mRNA-degrading endonuclease RelE of RelBE toxin-antitoxin system
MKTINWSTKAVRQLRKIPDPGEQDKIYNGIQTLVHFPECRNIKKLEGRDQYRLRVGRWWVLFSESLEIIEIQGVKKRNGHTY